METQIWDSAIELTSLIENYITLLKSQDEYSELSDEELNQLAYNNDFSSELLDNLIIFLTSATSTNYITWLNSELQLKIKLLGSVVVGERLYHINNSDITLNSIILDIFTNSENLLNYFDFKNTKITCIFDSDITITISDNKLMFTTIIRKL